MPVHFHVLASGSSGNACVLDVGGFGVLLDFGLSPRQLAPRMQRCGVAWDNIHAVLLTHTHTDHWQSATLAHLAKLRLPIYCHADHVQDLDRNTRAFAALESAGLFHTYEPGKRVRLHADCQCLPLSLSHDAAMTCGFRFEGARWALGYVADLGCWTPKLARQLADVNLLALEFNHDVALQLGSGRHPRLIRRVLGDGGHLSNDQGADLFAAVLKASSPGRVQHLVQLHLSRECNRADLAETAAQAVLDRLAIDMPIHTTSQDRAGPSVELGKSAKPRPRRAAPARRPFTQPMLPFAES